MVDKIGMILLQNKIISVQLEIEKLEIFVFTLKKRHSAACDSVTNLYLFLSMDSVSMDVSLCLMSLSLYWEM